MTHAEFVQHTPQNVNEESELTRLPTWSSGRLRTAIDINDNSEVFELLDSEVDRAWASLH